MGVTARSRGGSVLELGSETGKVVPKDLEARLLTLGRTPSAGDRVDVLQTGRAQLPAPSARLTEPVDGLALLHARQRRGAAGGAPVSLRDTSSGRKMLVCARPHRYVPPIVPLVPTPTLRLEGPRSKVGSQSPEDRPGSTDR